IANSSNTAIALTLGGGAASTATITSGPAHGTVSVSGRQITYTPTGSYTGTDSFQYTATNAAGTSSTATVSLTVANLSGNPPAPSASNSSESVLLNAVNAPIALALTGGAASGVTITTNPAHGAISVNGAQVTYTPTSGYTGADSFSYRATNTGGQS